MPPTENYTAGYYRTEQPSSDPSAEAKQSKVPEYTAEEKSYVKQHFQSEYHLLASHGMSIYKDEDREEGRVIARGFMEMDEQSNMEHEREQFHSQAPSAGYANETFHYGDDRAETRVMSESMSGTEGEATVDEDRGYQNSAEDPGNEYFVEDQGHYFAEDQGHDDFVEDQGHDDYLDDQDYDDEFDDY